MNTLNQIKAQKKLFKQKVFLCLILLIFLPSMAFAQPKFVFQVLGLKDPALANVIQRLTLDVKDVQNPDSTTLTTWYRSSGNVVLKAIEPYGFFYAKVSLLGFHRQKHIWTGSYQVYPGPPLRITAVHLRLTGPGQPNPSLKKAFRHPEIKAGMIFTVPEYEKARDRLLMVAQNQGYIMAKMTVDKVIINLKNHTCEVNLTLDTAPRYYFGPTTFSANPFANSFLDRFLNYDTKTPFSAKKLIHLQNNLNTPGYFRQVDVDPLIDQAVDHHVPIKVNLAMKKRKVYQFGLGYGTITGPRVTAGIDWRWVNRYGHQFKTNMSYSTVEKNLQAQYIIPAKFDPAHNQYTINAGYYTLRPRHGKSTVKKVGFGYLSNYGRWQRNLTLSYLLEHYQIDPDPHYRDAHVLLPSMSFTWANTKDPINVKNGARVYFNLQGGDKALASSVTFVQGEMRVKTLNTLWDNNRFILRGDVGYSIIQDTNKLPLSLRFYTGGPGSVRGYGIDSIGPGRYLTVGSGEYQRRVYKNFYGAVFYDVGNAFDNFDSYFSKLDRSTGLGVVWSSPIGDVSLYLAKALTSKGQPLRFEFNLGPVL